MMNRFAWIIVVFASLVALLAVGLTRDPSLVPSPFIGKPLPAFLATDLQAPERSVGYADLRGPAVINVWASWCIACRDEHPFLLELAEDDRYRVYGINYKDSREDATMWLARFGDPYDFSIADTDGKVGIEFGVYAVPETFVIDRAGIIRYKHIGPIDETILEQRLRPLLEELSDV